MVQVVALEEVVEFLTRRLAVVAVVGMEEVVVFC